MHVKILKDYTQIIDLVTHSCFLIWADAEKTEDGRKRAVAMKGIPTNEFQPMIYVSIQGFLSTRFTIGIQPPLSQRFGEMAMPYFWVHYKCISTCFQESEDKNNTCARCSVEQSPNLIPKFSASLQLLRVLFKPKTVPLLKHTAVAWARYCMTRGWGTYNKME